MEDEKKDIIQGIKPMLDLFEKGNIPKHMFEKWLVEHIQALRRNVDWEYRKEISKRLPGIDFMSFTGAKSTIDWFFTKVNIKDMEE